MMGMFANWVHADMSFGKKEYEFLSEIGIGPRNYGCYINGAWRGSGPVVSSVNPANNQVFLFILDLLVLLEYMQPQS